MHRGVSSSTALSNTCMRKPSGGGGGGAAAGDPAAADAAPAPAPTGEVRVRVGAAVVAGTAGAAPAEVIMMPTNTSGRLSSLKTWARIHGAVQLARPAKFSPPTCFDQCDTARTPYE